MEYKQGEGYDRLNSRPDNVPVPKAAITFDKSFRIVRKTFSIFKIYFPLDEELSRFKYDNLISLVNFYFIYLIVVEVRSNLLWNDSVGVSLSLTSGTICVVTLRIFVVKQVKLISQSLKKSYELLRIILNDPCPSVMSHIPFSFSFCFLVTLIFFGIYVYDFNKQSTMIVYEDYFFFGWTLNHKNPTTRIFIYILISILEALELITIYAFPGIVLILCCYQYSVIVGINKALANKVKKSPNMKVAMDEFLSYYAEVEFAVMSSENAISPLIFFVYAYIMSCLFQVSVIQLIM